MSKRKKIRRPIASSNGNKVVMRYDKRVALVNELKSLPNCFGRMVMSGII